MAKITIRDTMALPEGDCRSGRFRAAGGVRIGVAFAGDRDPIRLYALDLAAKAAVAIDGMAGGCLAYVRSGTVDLGGIVLDEGSSFVVEHGASVGAVASGQGCALLVFTVEAAANVVPVRAGGHVHAIAAEAVPRSADFHGDGRIGGAVFADAECPTCALWLHESTFHRPHAKVPLHLHNDDEIIVVTAGEIVLGPRTYGPGTAIAVARGTLYSFAAGHRGLTFINFRPTRPIYIPADRSLPPLDERDIYLKHMPAPVPSLLAEAA